MASLFKRNLSKVFFISLICGALTFWINSHSTKERGPTESKKPSSTSAAQVPEAKSADLAIESGLPADGFSVEDASMNPKGASVALAEFHACLQELSENTRQLKFLQLLERVNPEDIPALVEALKRYRKMGRNVDAETAALCRKWGEIDPAGGASYFKDQKDAWVADAYIQLFGAWSLKNWQAAQTWLNANPDHPHFESAFSGFLDGYAKTDSDGATRLTLSSLATDDPLLGKSLNRILQQVGNQKSATGALQWFDHLPTDPKGIKARKAVVENVYKYLPDEIDVLTEWAETQAGTPWRNNRLIGETAKRYAAIDPVAAMEWITNNPRPENDQTISGVGMVVKVWAAKDAGSFETWMNANRGTQLFSQASGDYAEMLAPTEPERSKYWLDQIDSEKYPGMRPWFERRIERGPTPPKTDAAK